MRLMENCKNEVVFLFEAGFYLFSLIKRVVHRSLKFIFYIRDYPAYLFIR